MSSTSVIKILLILAIVSGGMSLYCEICGEGNCVGSRNCDYLPGYYPGMDVSCFHHEANRFKGCIATSHCSESHGFECCSSYNCNNRDFSNVPTTLHPLDIEHPMSCMVCSGGKCLESKSCSYLPVADPTWGKKVCFSSESLDIKGCVQEKACTEANINCCYIDNCNNRPFTSVPTTLHPVDIDKALSCEICVEGNCVGGKFCGDYLPGYYPGMDVSCFRHEANRIKGCIKTESCNASQGIECCSTYNCNNRPFSNEATTLHPLDIEHPMSCMVCSGNTCVGSKSCSYLPVADPTWGKKVCFSSESLDMKGCIQEKACTDANIDCCYTDNCNGAHGADRRQEDGGYGAGKSLKSKFTTCFVTILLAIVALVL